MGLEMNHRLKEHDYAGRGFYFITAATYPRRNLFSVISDYKTHLTRLGEIVRDEWLRLHIEQPLLEQQEFEIMPDHFHGTIIATAPLPKPLGYYIGNFKGRTRQAIRKLMGDPAFEVWSRGYFDIVSLDADMFHSFRLYTKDNPRRKQLRDENRALFRKIRDATHARLPQNRHWTAVGDIALLDYPILVPVVVHRRRSPEETERTINHFVDLAASGAILVGGFISPGEKEVARRIAAIPNARVIYLLPHGMAHYKPRGKAVDRIANSQTLVLSGFGDEIPETPINYDNCHFNNDLAKAIAATPSAASAPPPAGGAVASATAPTPVASVMAPAAIT